LLVLITESDRLRVRLALTNAARNRERDARAIAAHAVAGVISHEIGQPLTAVSLNAAAGLSWLQRESPEIEKSVASLHATIEAGRKAADALASVRALFGQGRGKLKTPETICYEIFREILREARAYQAEGYRVLANQKVVDRLLDEESGNVAELETFIRRTIRFQVESMYSQEQYDVVLL
jgi:signal transduction histidine kinase